MAGKNTSASYRLPVTSEYHQKCISQSVKAFEEASERTDKTFSVGAYRNCNKVAQEKLWEEYVQNELKLSKNWEKTWGFMMEYQVKGHTKVKKQLPDKESYYNTTVPTTTSKHVGSRLQHPDNLEILKIEKTTCHKKRKTDLENYYS